MNIIELAKQAGLHIATDVNWMPIISLEYAEKFAALVAAEVRADERESFYGQDKPAECVEGCPPKQICDYCQIVAPVKEMILAARADEREECAKLCDEAWDGDTYTYAYSIAANDLAIAIRARGTT